MHSDDRTWRRKWYSHTCACSLRAELKKRVASGPVAVVEVAPLVAPFDLPDSCCRQCWTGRARSFGRSGTRPDSSTRDCNSTAIRIGCMGRTFHKGVTKKSDIRLLSICVNLSHVILITLLLKLNNLITFT